MNRVRLEVTMALASVCCATFGLTSGLLVAEVVALVLGAVALGLVLARVMPDET